MRKMLILALVAGTAVTLAAQAQSPAMNAKEKANLQHVLNWWLECLEGRNLDATAKYQADSYIQHNINFPTGRAGFMKVFGERFKAAGGPVTPAPTKFAPGRSRSPPRQVRCCLSSRPCEAPTSRRDGQTWTPWRARSPSTPCRRF